MTRKIALDGSTWEVPPEGSAEEFVKVWAKIIFYFVPKYVLTLVAVVLVFVARILACVALVVFGMAASVLTLAIGAGLCTVVLVGGPAIAVGGSILLPLIGMLWCLIHVNFKLAVFPSAVKWLYKFTGHPHVPEVNSPRSINISFLAEMLVESIPQFLLTLTNELLLNRGLNQSTDGLIVAYTLLSSLLAIMSVAYGFVVWGLRLRSFDMVLSEVFFQVTEEHNQHVLRRTAMIKSIGKRNATTATLRRHHESKWWPEAPQNHSPSSHDRRRASPRVHPLQSCEPIGARTAALQPQPVSEPTSVQPVSALAA